jgi:hypothetical protein
MEEENMREEEMDREGGMDREEEGKMIMVGSQEGMIIGITKDPGMMREVERMTEPYLEIMSPHPLFIHQSWV